MRCFLPIVGNLALLFSQTATGLGINCRGAGLCDAQSIDGASISMLISTLEEAVGKGYGDYHYNNGADLACTFNTCAFWQSGASGSINQALGYLNQLQAHGCGTCGSVPTDGNDVSHGELTVNYVANVCKSGLNGYNGVGGLCPPS